MTYTLDSTLLKLDNISLKFGEKTVLRDINIEVKDIVSTNQITGQVISLLGRSGVGKTQLMKIIAGLQKPTTGNVLIGKDQHPVKPGVVGMVLQTYPLFEHRTLLGNLQLACSDKEQIEFYLNEFDIHDHKNKYPRQLSGGQRQRAAIVQQILCSDHFVLLDEPYSGLDPVATEKLSMNINKLANRDDNNTVIISTHILSPALAISDSVWMLGYEKTKDVLDRDPEIKATNIDYGDVGNKDFPGATIRYTYDLAAEGLAWNPEIRHDPKFTQLVEQIRNVFQTL